MVNWLSFSCTFMPILDATNQRCRDEIGLLMSDRLSLVKKIAHCIVAFFIIASPQKDVGFAAEEWLSLARFEKVRSFSFHLVGGPKLTALEPQWPQGNLNLATDPTPKLIPKIFHQTYMTHKVPPAIEPLMQSWRLHNPDWNFRFYDDEACLDFVAREFPEYLEAYKGLPKNVERSDFFRWVITV